MAELNGQRDTPWGGSPNRGRAGAAPGGRGASTTAGSHRVFTKGRGGTRNIHTGGRPLSDYPIVMHQMWRAASTFPQALVPVIARNLALEVAAQGSRYKLRGHKGDRFPLKAKVQRNREVLRTATGQIARAASGKKMLGDYTDSRLVIAYPRGFWAIVERGSSRHLIAGRHRSGGRRFTAAAARSRFGARAKKLADGSFDFTPGAGGSFNDSNPVNAQEYGWKQFVIHPGHKPLGHPWNRAMVKAPNIVHQAQKRHASEALMRAWRR